MSQAGFRLGNEEGDVTSERKGGHAANPLRIRVRDLSF